MKKTFIFSIILSAASILAFGSTKDYGKLAKPVTINSINFPDSIFRAAIVKTTGVAEGETLTAAQVASVKSLCIHHKKLKSLKGIEHFVALEGLSCSHCSITEIDLSANKALRRLSCEFNELNSLDVSKNKELDTLECHFNPLASLDVTKNKKLVRLEFGHSQISNIDVSKNRALKSLICVNTAVSKLDVSKNT